MSPLINPDETHADYVDRVTRQAAESRVVHDNVTAFIRTAVPALVGSVIAGAVGLIPAVGHVVAWIDAQIRTAGLPGEGTVQVLGIVATVGVIAGYYEAARWAGRRWPRVEAIMLGSSRQPVYTPPTTETE